MNALSQIRQIDYTVIFARDMRAMRAFYESVMEFPVLRTLGDGWIEFAVGSNRLALRA
jgi:lactoylglutathione lyase